MPTEDQTPSRRTVLRTVAVAGSTLAVGGAAGTAAGQLTSSTAGSRKRGGRAQVDGDPDRNRPFTLQIEGTDPRSASCMSDESAQQTYLTYSVQYCDSGDEEESQTMYVIPDEAELVETETYVFRSVRPCRESDLQKVAFGPSQEEC